MPLEARSVSIGCQAWYCWLHQPRLSLLYTIWIMRLTYTIVGSHVHMDALEANRSRVQVEVDAPKGGSKGIGQAWPALVVKRVAFAEDQRSGLLGFWSGENGIVLWEVALD